MTETTPHTLRHHWRAGREIALLDLREEGPYSEAHPFWAVSVPVSEIEVLLPHLVPNRAVPVVVYDDGEGYVAPGLERIRALGYADVTALAGGLAGYRAAGEVFRDVNVPSKAFGELVESIRHTPSIPARELDALLASEPDMVVLDARRFEEFNTMSIPGGRSVPGGELVYRIADIAPSPDTLVVVNCAGRTRSIIGTQSLINAGVPNRVVALRNGTIGWTLAGLDVARRQTARGDAPTEAGRRTARERAAAWAAHVGVPTVDADAATAFGADEARTTFFLDVRDPAEFAAGHRPGFRSAPGGQLVQATDEWIGVRGARIVLADDDGVRAPMAASWLHQMGWEVHVLPPEAGTVAVPDAWDWTPPADVDAVAPRDLAGATRADLAGATVADLARSAVYRRGHVPGAWAVSGPELARDIAALPGEGPIVLVSPDGRLAAANLAVARGATTRPVHLLAGGTEAWAAAHLPLETEARFLAPSIDAYVRPYEGTDNAREKMQAYIDWELQLVAQLAKDGVSNFHVAR